MKVFVIFGTRPEAVKLAPVILRLQEEPAFRVKVLVTAQHRRMLDQVLELFGLAPDYDLNLMTPGQDLADLTGRVLEGVSGVLSRERPDLVLVQGDTTTSFAAALAAFYGKIPVGHVEAGLRSRDKYRPFPEELNRRLTGVLADYHFAPTAWARDNLLAEGVAPERIWVTGNTAIDAVQYMAARVGAAPEAWEAHLAQRFGLSLDGRRLILATGHRRENFGAGFANICRAIKDLTEHYEDLHIIYPVHLNPQVQQAVYQALGPGAGGVAAGGEQPPFHTAPRGRLSLLPPLEYAPFVYLLSRSYLVLTDSGGLQEEAPALGKPVLLMREVTERPEAVAAQTVKLVGLDHWGIFAGVTELLENPGLYRTMAQAPNPYGDGQAAARIVEVLRGID